MPATHWRVHIATMTPDQAAYDAELRRWLRQQGHSILAAPTASLEDKLAAARTADLCLVLLGARRGAPVPAASFAAAELEVSAAQDRDPASVLVFAQPGVDTPDSPEQTEFIQRLRSFAGGTFQATCATPAELLAQVGAALRAWLPPAQRASARPVAPHTAVMISSTGDLLAERQVIRAALVRQRLPVIDYLSAASEALPPVERVTRWAGESRALFLILGTRYGYISSIDGLGVTELEFATALRAGRPIVAFVRADAATTTDPDQQQFVARVQCFVPADQILTFAAAADLDQLVSAQVARLSRLRPALVPSVGLAEARAWHRRHLRRWLATLPVPARPERLALEDMPLLLTPTPPDPLATPTREWLGELWSPEFPLDIPTYTVEEAHAAAPRLLLLGGPGTGKSTVLRWYACSAPADTTPVYLALPRFAAWRTAGQGATLREYIQAEEARLLLAPAADRSQWLDELDAGRAVLLLDAFDGVPLEQQPAVAAEVQACAAALPAATSVVVAARTGGETGFDATAFARFYVAPLNQGQQQILITRWVAARAGSTVSAADQRKRVVRLLFQLRAMAELADWARSPLLLGLYTAVNDQGEDTVVLQPLTATAIYRRVLRAQLAQGDPPRRLREQEALLLALARQALTVPLTGTVIPAAALADAWQAIPDAPADPARRDEVLAALVERSGLLVRQPDGYSLLSPSFWSYLTARALAVAPIAQRLNYVAQRRLADAGPDLTAALVGELDWYGRHTEADQVITHLLACDDAPLCAAGTRDPFHLALGMACAAQGVRAEPYLRAEPGPTLARALERIWRAREYGMRQTLVWRFFELGPAAALARDCVMDALADDPKDLGMESGAIFSTILLNRLAASDIPWAVAERERRRPEQPAQDPDTAVIAAFDATLDELATRLDNPNPKVRALAATNLRKFGRLAVGCVPRLSALLADDDSFVRYAAAAALRGMNIAAAPARDALVALALGETDSFAGDQARQALRNLGTLAAPCLPQVAAALRAPEDATRKNALYLVASLGERARPLDEQVLACVRTDAPNRYAATVALRAIGAPLEPLFADLRAQLRDPDEQGRRAARDALEIIAYLKSDAAPLLPDLEHLLDTADSMERLLTLQALGALGPAAAPACERLRAFLRDDGFGYRAAVVAELGALGSAAWPALDDLYACLRDSQWTVRQAAVQALQSLQPPQSPALLQALTACLNDEQKLVSDAAYGALCALRPLSPTALNALLPYQAAYTGDDRVTYFARLNRAVKTILQAEIPAALRLSDPDPAAPTPVPAAPAPTAPVAARSGRRWWWFAGRRRR